MNSVCHTWWQAPLPTELCKPLLYVHTQIFLVIISPFFYFPSQNIFALPTYYYLFLKSRQISHNPKHAILAVSESTVVQSMSTVLQPSPPPISIATPSLQNQNCPIQHWLPIPHLFKALAATDQHSLYRFHSSASQKWNPNIVPFPDRLYWLSILQQQ